MVSQKMREAGKIAWKKKITPSEACWRRKLAKVYGKRLSQIIRHPSLLDMMLENKGKILFFEVKPLKGSERQTKLNRKQSETIRMMLQSKVGNSAQFYLAPYSGEKRIRTKKPIRITLWNIDKYSYKKG